MYKTEENTFRLLYNIPIIKIYEVIKYICTKKITKPLLSELKCI